MKNKLKDLCSITKGAIGIMKADGGKYPLVALSDERRSHSEFQFDAKAVIVPLISSTGHGHASMKRVHYQEGKFALGNILCAVIPNDETQLNAKYLHLYLQQFKETLLVPLMKGAANVSLPMNKLADVEIEVPSLERQLEIIELEEEAAEYKNELEERLIAQDGDVAKLRQALLREAMQGKLTKQATKDGNGKDLLEKIKAEKAKSGKREKSLLPFKSEEIPFEIPESWVWCRLGEVIEYTDNLDIQKHLSPDTMVNYVDIDAIDNINHVIKEAKQKQVRELSTRARRVLRKGFIAYSTVRPYLKNIAIIEDELENYIGSTGFNVFKTINVELKFMFYYLLSPHVNKSFKDLMVGFNSPSITNEQFEKSLFPLPPFNEQTRIVKRIEQLMQLCDELQYSIQQSKIENEKLLQGALRDALKKEPIGV
jgi:type I restriction enzyme S subunit